MGFKKFKMCPEIHICNYWFTFNKMYSLRGQKGNHYVYYVRKIFFLCPYDGYKESVLLNIMN